MGVRKLNEPTLNGPGGHAGPDLCPKHLVPMIHTINEVTLCAVCQHVDAREANATIARMLRKLDHGCWDANCSACDRP